MRIKNIKTLEIEELEDCTWGTGWFDLEGDEAFIGDTAVDQYGEEFIFSYGPCQANRNSFSNVVLCVHAFDPKSGERYQLPDWYRFTIQNKLLGG